MTAAALIALVALAWEPAAAGAAETRIRVPQEARGQLESDVPATGVLSSRSLSVEGRAYDCWVFGIEPGDIAVLSAASDAFDPVLLVLPGPVCAGSPPLFVADAADGAPRHAHVAFEAPRNAFAVLVGTSRPGEAGPYRLIYRNEIVNDSPQRALTPSEPERLAALLYADHGPRDFSDPAVIDRVFEAAVGDALKALNAETAGVGLGFDFLVDGQDSDITAPDIRLRVLLASSALVDARFENMGRPTHMVFHMRETAAGWRVEDIESRTPDNDLNWVLSRELGLDLGVAAARQD